MHPLTVVFAILAIALALPAPHPANNISNSILGSVDGLLGTPTNRKAAQAKAKASECRRRFNSANISTCIDNCVAQCLVDDDGCHTCIRGCVPQHVCDDDREGRRNRDGERGGRNRDNDRNDRTN
ncbi:hypothetical protein GGR54DRAFT_644304 [Hypoxylon sp. NC1633]|nr:hypothetical protein GGR54DRAFT_644304 [Hypoxylon sp. NC1633]